MEFSLEPNNENQIKIHPQVSEIWLENEMSRQLTSGLDEMSRNIFKW